MKDIRDRRGESKRRARIKSGLRSEEIKVEKMKKKRSVTYSLISYEELPEYMKDNEFILGFYRANWPLKEALLSVFTWHNETLNVWTHLIGFFVFLGLTIGNVMHVPQVAYLLGFLSRSIPTNSVVNASVNSGNIFSAMASSVDLEETLSSVTSVASTWSVTRWPFFVYMAGSMFCLLSSSICHLFCCHSRDLSVFLLRLDYAGIAVMIITSFFPPIYYIFQCDPHWQFVYLTGITAMGVFTVITLLSPTLSTGAFRSYRAFLFLAMGFFGIVPAIHALVVNWNEPRRATTLAYELTMAFSYITGTVFYVSRVPERWKPGFFDLAGHSHQIFHLFVIAGALAHYGAAHVFLEWRDSAGCNRIM